MKVYYIVKFRKDNNIEGEGSIFVDKRKRRWVVILTTDSDYIVADGDEELEVLNERHVYKTGNGEEQVFIRYDGQDNEEVYKEVHKHIREKRLSHNSGGHVN